MRGKAFLYAPPMTSSRRRRPTLDDVAEAVGVSRATVSNAYNRPDQLSAQLREQILRVAGELGYPGPNPTARSLATNRTGAIAFLLDSSLSAAFSDPALSITLDALAKTVEPTGNALLLLPGREAQEGPPAARVLAAQADIAVAYSSPTAHPRWKPCGRGVCHWWSSTSRRCRTPPESAATTAAERRWPPAI